MHLVVAAGQGHHSLHGGLELLLGRIGLISRAWNQSGISAGSASFIRRKNSVSAYPREEFRRPPATSHPPGSMSMAAANRAHSRLPESSDPICIAANRTHLSGK